MTEVGTGSGAVYKAISDRVILQGLLSDSSLDAHAKDFRLWVPHGPS